MCIAIVSPKGTALPSKDRLERCFRANPDGAGMAFAYNGSVYTYKGFFTFQDFYDQLTECDRRYDLTSCGVLLHCRIRTSGATDSSMCHPFPITTSEAKLTASFSKSDFAIIHNGMIDLTARSSDKEKFSDTAFFVREYLTKIAAYDNWFKNKSTIPLIESLIKSKMAIMNGSGDVIMTSGFHQADDGCYYSNYSYEEPFYGYYGYGYFDDEDWYREYYGNGSNTCEIPLSRLAKNEMILYEDETVEEFDANYHERYATYATETGEIYTLFCKKHSNRINFEDLSFVGVGQILDRSLREIPFRTDAVAVL